MKKRLFIGGIVCIIGIMTVTLLIAYFNAENIKNIRFLKSYGWNVESKPIEKCEMTIPPAFDNVYENYNILQQKAGLDLSPYCGEEAVRYTYILKNFPYETADEVRANVVDIKGKPVAGDIMTVSLGGFMYSLNFNESVCFSINNG